MSHQGPCPLFPPAVHLVLKRLFFGPVSYQKPDLLQLIWMYWFLVLSGVLRCPEQRSDEFPDQTVVSFGGTSPGELIQPLCFGAFDFWLGQVWAKIFTLPPPQGGGVEKHQLFSNNILWHKDVLAKKVQMSATDIPSEKSGAVCHREGVRESWNPFHRPRDSCPQSGCQDGALCFQEYKSIFFLHQILSKSHFPLSCISTFFYSHHCTMTVFLAEVGSEFFLAVFPQDISIIFSQS